MEIIEMLEASARWIGYIVMVMSSSFVLGYFIIGICALINRAFHAALDCYGGMKTFLVYREWYHQQKDKKE